MEESVYKLRQNAEGTRAGLQIAPRKKKTGKWRKGLDHIQGRDYHQTSPTSPNTVSTNQTTKLSHSPTTPNPRRDTPGEKGVGERRRPREGKHYSERYRLVL